MTLDPSEPTRIVASSIYDGRTYADPVRRPARSRPPTALTLAVEAAITVHFRGLIAAFSATANDPASPLPSPMVLASLTNTTTSALASMYAEEISMAGARALNTTLAAHPISHETVTNLARLVEMRRLQAAARRSSLILKQQRVTKADASPTPLIATPPPPPMALDLRLDLVNPYAIHHARAMSIDLVGHLTEESLGAVRRFIAEGFERELTIPQTAARISQVVGLHPRYVAAVVKFRDGLMSRGAEFAFADRQAAAYAERLRKSRARTIARTETLRASNLGRLSSWEVAASAGAISHLAVKEWITAPLGRLSAAESKAGLAGPPCHICTPMAGKRVAGLRSAFLLPTGARLVMPPAHPNCRCTVIVHPPEIPDV